MNTDLTSLSQVELDTVVGGHGGGGHNPGRIPVPADPLTVFKNDVKNLFSDGLNLFLSFF
jgi:hypothetical protein